MMAIFHLFYYLTVYRFICFIAIAVLFVNYLQHSDKKYLLRFAVFFYFIWESNVLLLSYTEIGKSGCGFELDRLVLKKQIARCTRSILIPFEFDIEERLLCVTRLA